MTGPVDEGPLRVDAYLDELLSSRARHVDAPDGATAEVAHAATVARDALVRFHPSFRFEEALAARLRAVATGARTARGEGADLVVFRGPAVTPPEESLAEEPRPGSPTTAGSTTAERGWMLVGGAIASGVSLAAGVLLARRRARHDARLGRPA